MASTTDGVNKYAPTSTSAMSYIRFTLPPTITPGILSIPSANPSEAKAACERLLEKDREEHHCFFNPSGFHNHLSHHLLAGYDLGASAQLLQAQYDDETKGQQPIDAVLDRATKEAQGHYDVSRNDLVIDENNWKKHLTDKQCYAPYVAFFTKRIQDHGMAATLHDFVWGPEANSGGADMLWSLTAGIFHPLIQVGYALEFNSPAMLAQGLAQTALHLASNATHFGFPPFTSSESYPPHPPTPVPVLQILRQVYDSDVLKPVMPYDPDAFLTARLKGALGDGSRPAEIRRLCAQWWSSDKEEDITEPELESKIEELVWVATLLLGATSKRGKEPRLDFFLMHLLNSTIFLSSYLRVMSKELKGEEQQRKGRVGFARILKSTLPVFLLTMLIRGRPRIDVDLVMSYPANPLPNALKLIDEDGEAAKRKQTENPSALAADETNPWLRIIADVLHAPDAHTLKAIRILYYGAQKYGMTGPGRVVGAFHASGSGIANGNDTSYPKENATEETLKGSAKLDGSVFVRVAGIVMHRLGWVTYGEKDGSWDRSGLGWDDAWKTDP